MMRNTGSYLCKRAKQYWRKWILVHVYPWYQAAYKEKLQHLILQETKLKLRTYTGEPVLVLGKVDVTVEHNWQKKTVPLYIIPGNHPALLGHSWLRKLRLNWQKVFLVNDGNTSPLQRILKKHSKVFDGELGSMKDITVKLTVKPGSTPNCLKARPVLYAIKPKVEAELDRLVEYWNPWAQENGLHQLFQSRKRMGPQGSLVTLKWLWTLSWLQNSTHYPSLMTSFKVCLEDRSLVR